MVGRLEKCYISASSSSSVSLDLLNMVNMVKKQGDGLGDAIVKQQHEVGGNRQCPLCVCCL